ncbi:hypothetical protein HQ571_06310 [Candidatus Kuenenbacteria bacterium]|nr:hypothetical protein [Candidatus Kuenenbacteria bacterium]
MNQVGVVAKRTRSNNAHNQGIAILHAFTASQIGSVFESWSQEAKVAGIQLPYCARKEESKTELLKNMQVAILRTAISLISVIPKSLRRKGKATIRFERVGNTAIGKWQGVKSADDIDLRLTFEIMLSGEVRGTAAELLKELFLKKLFSGEFNYINLERKPESDNDTLILTWSEPTLAKRIARVEELMIQ